MAPINLPDGSQVSEIVLPDGSTASKVLAPDGSTVFSAIPDSVVYQYLTSDFTTSNWPDNEGGSDIDTISGLSKDDTAFDGDGGVSGDGNSDYGQSDTMGSYGSGLDSTWAFAYRFNTTDDSGSAVHVGTYESDASHEFMIGCMGFAGNSVTKLNFQMDGVNGSSDRIIIQSTTTVTDGSDHIAILNKEGTDNDASDFNFYFAPDSPELDINTDNSFTTEDFTNPMTYFAQNDGSGGTRRHADLTIDTPMWFGSSLNQSERHQVFNFYG